MQCWGRLEWCLYCRVLPFSHCYSQGKGAKPILSVFEAFRVYSFISKTRLYSQYSEKARSFDHKNFAWKDLETLWISCTWRSELENSTILCIGAGDWRLETRRNLDIPGSWDTAGDTDRAERGQRRAAELSPDTGGHPTLTTPRTHQHRGHYQFILLGGYCLRCIFIALAKVNKCNQQDIYLIPACHIPKKEVS